MPTAVALFRPYHETIVEDILVATNEGLVFIAGQLKKNIIPANHDQIIEAWNKRRHQMCWGDLDLGVPAALLRQKEIVEAKTVWQNRQPGIELGELQNAMETFLSLSYGNGHHSMTSWHVRLRERLESLHRLLSQTLGK